MKFIKKILKWIRKKLGIRKMRKELRKLYNDYVVKSATKKRYNRMTYEEFLADLRSSGKRWIK